MDTKDLRVERRRIVEQMREIVNHAEAEDRPLSAEESERWGKLEGAEGRLSDRIERQETVEAKESRLAELRPLQVADKEIVVAGERDIDAEVQRSAFASYLRGGMSALNTEQRQVMTARYQALSPEMRALSSGTDATGGFAVADEFERQVVMSMKAFGGMREAGVRIVPSSSGADLLVPNVDDTSNKGAILSENTQVTEQDLAFAQKTISSYMYTSKLVRVSFQLLQDAEFPIESWLSEQLGIRLGRITNEHYTTGTGTGQPQGVVTGSSVGRTGAAGQVTTIIYEDVVELEHSVDPSYRRGARFMMSDAMLKELKKLKDSDGRPLWVASMAVGEPNTILGYPYVINQDVAVPAASAKSLLFGDFAQYWIRDVRGITLLRLGERYADFLQVGFLAFLRTGGGLVDAGTDPIKHYAHPAA